MFNNQNTNVRAADLHAGVAAFCEYYDVGERSASEDALRNAAAFASLVRGYVEMARLNSQICAEYTACEAEADKLIR